MVSPSRDPFVWQFFISRLQMLIFSSFRRNTTPLKNSTQALSLAFTTLLHLLETVEIHQELLHASFLKELADTWKHLQQETKQLEQIGTYPYKVKEKIQSLLQAIGAVSLPDYPPLSYYLSEPIGPEWTPFPLLSLLQQLPQYHPETLTAWKQSIQEILSDLPFVN